jgi:hypothetical protein
MRELISRAVNSKYLSPIRAKSWTKDQVSGDGGLGWVRGI